MSTKRRIPRRLSLDDFDAAAAGLRMTRRNLSAARAVLVDGETSTSVATAMDVTPQSVSQSAGRVYRAHLERVGAPDGWQTVTVTVPEPLARKITEEALQARQDYVAADSKSRLRRVFAHEQKPGGGRK